MMKSVFIGCGAYLPQNSVTNDDLATMVDTSDEWIFSRTGISNRHIAADDELTSDLAYNASVEALASAGMVADELDLIVLATATMTMIMMYIRRRLLPWWQPRFQTKEIILIRSGKT